MRDRDEPIILADTSWSRNGDGMARYSREILERIPHIAVPSQHFSLHPANFLKAVVEIRRSRPDVFFTPGFNPPLYSSSVPYVFSIADLIHLDFPAESSPGKALYYSRFLKGAAKRAYRVLTVSDFSKKAIVRWASLEPCRVVVNGNGVDTAVFRPDGPKHSPGYPYFFYVGNSKPHKNLLRLLEGFAMALAGLDRSIRLVLTGPKAPELRESAAAREIGARLQFSGRLTEAELAAYYRGAMAFAFPTLLEGFGLPALEAMACGTPVICSDSSSLPEVVGDAALLVDPESAESISQGLIRAASNEAEREAMRTRGLARCSLFDWDRVARTTRQVLVDAGRQES